jgi:hypothetical protein
MDAFVGEHSNKLYSQAFHAALNKQNLNTITDTKKAPICLMGDSFLISCGKLCFVTICDIDLLPQVSKVLLNHNCHFSIYTLYTIAELLYLELDDALF